MESFVIIQSIEGIFIGLNDDGTDKIATKHAVN